MRSTLGVARITARSEWASAKVYGGASQLGVLRETLCIREDGHPVFVRYTLPPGGRLK